MTINYIKVTIKDLGMSDVTIKLPMNNTDLQKILIKKEITESSQAMVEHFDNAMKSVTGIEIRNFAIKPPTNIYYLNTYLEILKTENIDLPSEPIEITTAKLKEMIADLLEVDNKDMTLEEIYDVINGFSDDASSKETDPETVDKRKKPLFSIKKLQEKHLERKGK